VNAKETIPNATGTRVEPSEATAPLVRPRRRPHVARLPRSDGPAQNTNAQ
jgi:hypothetical protein